jgi:hypothetical protein
MVPLRILHECLLVRYDHLDPILLLGLAQQGGLLLQHRLVHVETGDFHRLLDVYPVAGGHPLPQVFVDHRIDVTDHVVRQYHVLGDLQELLLIAGGDGVVLPVYGPGLESHVYFAETQGGGVGAHGAAHIQPGLCIGPPQLHAFQIRRCARRTGLLGQGELPSAEIPGVQHPYLRPLGQVVPETLADGTVQDPVHVIDVTVQVGDFQNPDLGIVGHVREPGRAAVAGHLQGTFHDPEKSGFLVSEHARMSHSDVDLAAAQHSYDFGELVHRRHQLRFGA